MSNRHDVQQLGFKTEAIEGTDPIESGGTYYYFGPEQASPGNFLTYEKEIVPYFTDDIEPAEMVLVDKKVTKTIGFTMSNGLMLYYLLGDSSSAASLHTLSYIKVPKTLTVRQEWGPTGSVLHRSATACKVGSVVINFDFKEDFEPVTFGVNIEGRTYGVANTDTDETPVHPVSGNQTPDDVFMKDIDTSNQLIKWDTTDYSNELLTVQLTLARGLKWLKYHNSATSAKIHSRRTANVVTFTVRRNDKTDILIDFEADSEKDLQLKLYSSAAAVNNYYMNLTMTTDLQSVTPNIAVIENNEVPIYECAGVVKTFVPIFKDGVADALYGD